VLILRFQVIFSTVANFAQFVFAISLCCASQVTFFSYRQGEISSVFTDV